MEARYNAAQCKSLLGDAKGALADLNFLIEHDPAYSTRAEEDPDFDPIRKDYLRLIEEKRAKLYQEAQVFFTTIKLEVSQAKTGNTYSYCSRAAQMQMDRLISLSISTDLPYRTMRQTKEEWEVCLPKVRAWLEEGRDNKEAEERRLAYEEEQKRLAEEKRLADLERDRLAKEKQRADAERDRLARELHRKEMRIRFLLLISIDIIIGGIGVIGSVIIEAYMGIFLGIMFIIVSIVAATGVLRDDELGEVEATWPVVRGTFAGIIIGIIVFVINGSASGLFWSILAGVIAGGIVGAIIGIINCAIAAVIRRSRKSESSKAGIIALVFAGAIVLTAIITVVAAYRKHNSAAAPVEAPAPAAVPQTAEVTSYRLNMRSGPGANSNTLKTLRQGDMLTVTGGEQNGWLPVEHEGTRGWISADRVRTNAGVKPAADSAETSGL